MAAVRLDHFNSLIKIECGVFGDDMNMVLIPYLGAESVFDLRVLNADLCQDGNDNVFKRSVIFLLL